MKVFSRVRFPQWKRAVTRRLGWASSYSNPQ